MITRLGAGPDNVRLGCGRGKLQLMVKIAAQETDHAESLPSPRPPRESLLRAESSTNPMHAPNPLPLSFVSVWVFAGYCDWQNSFFWDASRCGRGAHSAKCGTLGFPSVVYNLRDMKEFRRWRDSAYAAKDGDIIILDEGDAATPM